MADVTHIYGNEIVDAAARQDIADLETTTNNLKDDLIAYDEGVKPVYQDHSVWNRGYINSSGTFVQANNYATPTVAPFLLPKGTSISVHANGLNCTYVEYAYNSGTYTRIQGIPINGTSEETFTYPADQYVGLYVNKPGGAALLLSEITTTVFETTNTQKQINTLTDDLDSVSGDTDRLKIDMEHINSLDIEDTFNMYKDTIYDEKETVSLPYNGAEKYARKVSGNNVIYTGTYNIADLFGFPDNKTLSEYGVNVAITKNHVEVSGTPTQNLYVSISGGKIYTDSSVMRAEGRKYILPSIDVFVKGFYTRTTGNNAVVVQSLISGNIVSVSSGSRESAKIAASENWGQVYFYLPSGAAVDIAVDIGLFTDFYSSSYRVETESNVRKITNSKIFALGEMTFSESSSEIVLESVNNFGFESTGRKILWLGDSISMLQSLPERASRNIGCVVYNCSFAGAPMTYGNPRYEGITVFSLSEQIASGDFTKLDTALANQAADGIDVTKKLINAAQLKALDFSEDVTDIVIMAGTNDLQNAYVTTDSSLTAFSAAVLNIIDNLNSAYPNIRLYFITDPYRGDITPSNPDDYGHSLLDINENIINRCREMNIPVCDLYHTSGINSLTMGVYLMNDHLHQTATGDILLADKCAKWLLAN